MKMLIMMPAAAGDDVNVISGVTKKRRTTLNIIRWSFFTPKYDFHTPHIYLILNSILEYIWISVL